MKTYLLIIAFLAPLPAAAKKRAPAEARPANHAHIMQLDEDFPIDELDEDPDVEVHRLGDADPYALPPVSIQKGMLRAAGLESVLGWDPVERDIFFGMAGESDLAFVAKKYEGRVSADSIRRLRREIEGYRAQKARGR